MIKLKDVIKSSDDSDMSPNNPKIQVLESEILDTIDIDIGDTIIFKTEDGGNFVSRIAGIRLIKHEDNEDEEDFSSVIKELEIFGPKKVQIGEII